MPNTTSQTPKISVIIPFYNSGKTLKNSIQSVINQTFIDFELLLVNDASSDNVLDEIKLLLDDPRIKIITHSENQGAAASRNTGIKHATGKYVAFLDADDIWYKDKLTKQYAFMENAPDNIKASCTSFDMVRYSGNTGKRFLSKDKDWTRELIGGCSVSPGSTLIAHRSLFSELEIGPYPSDMRRLEDWDWLLNYIYKYKLGVIEDYLAQINVSGYPRYISVKTDSTTLLKKQKAKLLENFGKQELQYFKAGLEIEKGGTAFRNRLYGRAILHLFKSFYKSPMRAIKFTKRIAIKLYRRDYGGFKQTIK